MVPAREERERGPGAVAAAGVEVGRVRAERGRGVRFRLADEDRAACCGVIWVCAFAEGEVAGAAHGCGGVGHGDGGGVVAVEGDGDFERVGRDGGQGWGGWVGGVGGGERGEG